MAQKVTIIGAGVAGLCTASLLQQKGFETQIFEAHKRAGGLMTYWNRGDYRVETCIHWFIGSHKDSTFYRYWNQVLDMEKIEFYDHEILNVFEDKEGNSIVIYTDTDRLEKELLEKAPEDKSEILVFTKAIRTIADFKMPLDYGGNKLNFLTGFRFFIDNFTKLGEFQKWTKISESEYATRFKNPLLKRAIEYLFMPEMAMIFILFSLAWMHKKHAGYPIGGSFKVAKLMEEKLLELGGKIHYKSLVTEILVENNKAIGVKLADDSVHYSDFVVSAADLNLTLNTLLKEKFTDSKFENRVDNLKIFPSYLQVSLGIKRKLDEFYPSFDFELDKPFYIDQSISLDSMNVRLFPYDKTFYPEGSSMLTVFLPTFNFEYWNDLRTNNNEFYQQEKKRVLEATIDVLDKRMGNLREHIEMTDISSPASVYRYTRNTKGSMEGWLMTTKESFSTLPNSLKGLKNFYLAGQWISPGGGLPSGIITAIDVVDAISKHKNK